MEILLREEDGIRHQVNYLQGLARTILRILGYKDEDGVELSLYFVGDTTMRELNRRYRGKNKTTDVLSFQWPSDCPSNMGDIVNLGDIVISIPTAAKYAAKNGYDLNMELVVLLVHGILHLSGFDHENVDQETANIMFSIQEQLLGEVLDNGRFA